MASYSDERSGNALSLPLVSDQRTVMYVKFAKVMVIFQGPVTASRQALISTFESKYKHSCRVISDASYTAETGLSLIPQNTEDFYQYFKSKVKRTCEDGYNLIVINQSMSNSRQIKYFMFLAQKFQYVVLPLPHLVTEKIAAQRMPKSNLASSYSKDTRLEFHNYFNHLLCGWFLHDVDSAEMREEVKWYVKDCFDEITEFDDLFSQCCKPDSFKTFYQMDDVKQEIAFCLMKIIKTPIDANEYMSKEVFQKYYGRMAKLYVVGFIVSPHIVAARVKLTYEQKQLWALPDDLPDSFKPKLFISDIKNKAVESNKGESLTLIASKSNRTLINGDRIDEPELAIPYNAKGRSCHILLGKIKNAPKRNVDYDVPFAVYRERTVVQDPQYRDKVEPYDLARCKVRRIGKYWFIYLKETIVVNGLFASYCEAESNIV